MPLSTYLKVREYAPKDGSPVPYFTLLTDERVGEAFGLG
jgi:hypothetical protein